MPPVALIIAGGLVALVVLVLLIWILRRRRSYAFLHVPSSAEGASVIPDILRSKEEPLPAAPEPPAEKVAEQPEEIPAEAPIVQAEAVLVAAPVEVAPEPEPEVVREPELAPEPEPEPELAPVPSASAAAAGARPDFVMEAPVELWLGEARIGIRAGSHSHQAFLRYANELLGDLKAARSDAR